MSVENVLDDLNVDSSLDFRRLRRPNDRFGDCRVLKSTSLHSGDQSESTHEAATFDERVCGFFMFIFLGVRLFGWASLPECSFV